MGPILGPDASWRPPGEDRGAQRPLQRCLLEPSAQTKSAFYVFGTFLLVLGNALKILDVISKITCYGLPIDCLLIALDANMFSHNGYGPGTRTQGPKAAGPGPGGPQLLGPGPGSRAHNIMAEHMCIKGNQ